MPHPHESPAGDAADLPCAEALLTGALAFMTAHAQACCEPHRQQMTRKTISTLAMLAEHPVLSPDFRAALADLNVLWRRIEDNAGRAEQARFAAAPHAAPGAIH